MSNAKNIMILKKEGNKFEEVPFKVESINIFQFMKTLNVVREIIKIAQEDASIRTVIDALLDATEVEAAEGMTPEEAAEEADAAFMGAALQAFEVVLANLPEKALELVSVTSGIEINDLGVQKIETLFDAYDAVIEVNDIAEIIERGKKSLSGTLNKVNFAKFTKKKAAQ